MRTVQLNIELPNLVKTTEFELKTLLASKLYEREELSLGQAAKLAGLSKRAFIEIMGNYDVSLFSENEEDIRADIANA
jgi:predicted HTH domain antitoxin